MIDQEIIVIVVLGIEGGAAHLLAILMILSEAVLKFG